MEPRIRVSAILRREGRILLIRHERQGMAYWLLPGGGVHGGESIIDALQRELSEEVGIEEDLPLEGPVALCESISPAGEAKQRHVVHIIFAGYLGNRSLETVTSRDAAVRGHRLFGLDELSGLPVHPPIQRFLSRWQPGD